MALSASSLGKLKSCHPDLRRIADKLAARLEFIVVCGHRSEADQAAAVKNKTSKLHWPQSKHNMFPSRAFDLARHPLDWTDIDGFKSLGAEVKKVADELGIKVRWGGDWDMDGDTSDQRFNDYPHFELVD